MQETMEHMRFNEGKPELSYILTFPTAMESLSSVMQYGAKKYARGNYLVGSQATEYVDSLLRHLQALMQGVLVDEESGCLHVGHMLFNVAMLAEVIHNQPEKNDLLTLSWVKAQVPPSTGQGSTPAWPKWTPNPKSWGH